MEKLTVNNAQPTDARLVAQMLTEATHHKLDHNDTAWGLDGWSEETAGELIGRSPSFVARRDGEAVGTLTLLWEDEQIWGPQPPIAGYIHRLAVRDGYHGQGLGEQLIEWALAEVTRNNRYLLRLDCNAENTGLCSYYEKLGFIQVGTTRQTQDNESPNALYERSVLTFGLPT